MSVSKAHVLKAHYRCEAKLKGKLSQMYSPAGLDCHSRMGRCWDLREKPIKPPDEEIMCSKENSNCDFSISRLLAETSSTGLLFDTKRTPQPWRASRFWPNAIQIHWSTTNLQLGLLIQPIIREKPPQRHSHRAIQPSPICR